MKAKDEGFPGWDKESGLCEHQACYDDDFENKDGLLNSENARFWKTIL